MNDGFEGNGFAEVKQNNQPQGQGGYSGGGNQNYGQGNRNYQNNNGGGGFQQRQGGYSGGGGGYGNNNGGGNRNFQNNRGQGGGFQRKPQEPEGPVEFYLPYAITANKEVPADTLMKMKEIILDLQTRGYTMRTPGREGPEDLFDKTATKKEIHLPWRNFMDKDSKFAFTPEGAKVLAGQLLPSFDGLKPGIQTIIAADVKMMMGKELRAPALFLITWSEDGAETLQEKTAKTGNTGLAIAIACKLKVPVFNLGKPGTVQRLQQYLGNNNEQQKETPAPTASSGYGHNHNQGNSYANY